MYPGPKNLTNSFHVLYLIILSQSKNAGYESSLRWIKLQDHVSFQSPWFLDVSHRMRMLIRVISSFTISLQQAFPITYSVLWS
jgi:hypothetical protein